MSRKPLILISLLLAAFVITLDTTIVNVALPTLVRELHASDSQLQWVVDAFNLLFAASVLALGSLSDRFGRKGMLLAGLAVFGLASLAGGLTESTGALIAARSVMGVGAAMVFPSTLSLISNVFTERRERALAIGLWGATTGAAIALGPIVGGGLLQVFDWRSIFLAMTPLAAIAAALVARFVPTSRDPHAPRTDRAGFALSTATVGLLVYTIIEAPNHGWGSAATLGGFALTVLLAAAFAAWERRTEQPMLDLSLFGNPRFTAASASVAISFFALSGFIFLVTQYFQFLKGYGPLSTGVRLLPVAICVAISSILGTRMAVRFGTKLVVASGLFSMAAFYVWVTTVSARTGYGTIAAQMVVLGTGMGLTSAPATEAIMGVVPMAKAGVGSAVNDATRLLGGTLGVAVIGSVYAALYASRLTTALPVRLSPAVVRTAHSSVGAALTAASKLGASRPPIARVGRPRRGERGLLPRLPGRQLPRGRRRRGRRSDGALTAARPANPHQRRKRGAGIRHAHHSPRAQLTPPPSEKRQCTMTEQQLTPRQPRANSELGRATGFELAGRGQAGAANIESALERNRAFAAAGGHHGAVVFPNLRLFVITCLDPRTDPAHFLALGLSDAMVVRNVGGRVTPEVINDVAFIGQLAESALPDGPLFEVAVIHHTQCGTGALVDDAFRRRYAERIGADETTLREHAVLDPAATVTSDVRRLRSAPAISPRVTVSGHVYDVVTGLVETILPAESRTV